MVNEIFLGRGRLLELALEEPLHAAPKAGDLLVGAEDAGEILRLRSSEGAVKCDAARMQREDCGHEKGGASDPAL